MYCPVQAVQRGLQQLAGQPETAQAVVDALRIVDNYVKAYYISWGEDLQRCAFTFPSLPPPPGGRLFFGASVVVLLLLYRKIMRS